MAKRGFGELESRILYILKSGERMTVKEVHRAIGEEDNYNTIMTVMSRLEKKGLLHREKMGLQYEYWLSKEVDNRSIFEKLKHKFLGIKTSLLVSHLIETADDLTEEELREMEELIQKMRESKK